VLKHGRMVAVKEKEKTHKEEIVKLMFMEAHEHQT
jgi:ABC-type sugar transport system ATPase subunit